MCGGSPLSVILFFLFCFVVVFMSGRIHRRGEIISTLVLPSIGLEFGFISDGYSVVGENTQVGVLILYSRSPLYEPDFQVVSGVLFSCRGEYVGGQFLTTLVLLL